MQAAFRRPFGFSPFDFSGWRGRARGWWSGNNEDADHTAAPAANHHHHNHDNDDGLGRSGDDHGDGIPANNRLLWLLTHSPGNRALFNLLLFITTLLILLKIDAHSRALAEFLQPGVTNFSVPRDLREARAQQLLVVLAGVELLAGTIWWLFETTFLHTEVFRANAATAAALLFTLFYDTVHITDTTLFFATALCRHVFVSAGTTVAIARRVYSFAYSDRVNVVGLCTCFLPYTFVAAVMSESPDLAVVWARYVFVVALIPITMSVFWWNSILATDTLVEDAGGGGAGRPGPRSLTHDSRFTASWSTLSTILWPAVDIVEALESPGDGRATNYNDQLSIRAISSRYGLDDDSGRLLEMARLAESYRLSHVFTVGQAVAFERAESERASADARLEDPGGREPSNGYTLAVKLFAGSSFFDRNLFIVFASMRAVEFNFAHDTVLVFLIWAAFSWAVGFVYRSYQKVVLRCRESLPLTEPPAHSFVCRYRVMVRQLYSFRVICALIGIAVTFVGKFLFTIVQLFPYFGNARTVFDTSVLAISLTGFAELAYLALSDLSYDEFLRTKGRNIARWELACGGPRSRDDRVAAPPPKYEEVMREMAREAGEQRQQPQPSRSDSDNVADTGGSFGGAEAISSSWSTSVSHACRLTRATANRLTRVYFGRFTGHLCHEIVINLLSFIVWLAASSYGGVWFLSGLTLLPMAIALSLIGAKVTRDTDDEP